MKTVVHVVESFSTGVYSWIKEVCANTSKIHTNSVIFSERVETPISYLTDFKNSTLIKVEMKREINPLVDLKSATTVKNEINTLQPNIIHCHSSKAGFITRLLRPFIKGNPKIIYTPHGISFERKDISTISKIIFILLENVASIFSRTVLCCSKSESEIYKKFVPFAKCDYIENFCDIAQFESFYLQRLQRLNISKEPALKIITVGGIRKQKNPEQFAAIAKLLSNYNAHLTWVGDGEPDDVLNLQEAGVEVTAWLSADEVKHKLSQSDIYLQTSLWEGMPIAVIEAMAAGLPCIVSNIPGNIDCVTHDVDGYIFNHEGEAADYIQGFSDREKLVTFSKASRNTAENGFSMDVFIKKLTDFYQKQVG